MGERFRVAYVVSARCFSTEHCPRKISEIGKAWRRMGFSVQLICGGDIVKSQPNSQDAWQRLKSKLRSQPDRSGWYMPIYHSLSECRSLIHDKRFRAYLSRKANEERPDLIWHRPARLHQAPLLVARELGVPYVVEWLDNVVAYRSSLFRRKALAVEHRRMREADRVVVVSHALVRNLAASEGLPAKRFVVAHNAVDTEEFTRDPAAGARIRERLGIPADAFVAGYVGSFAWYHETTLIPRAAKILQEQVAKPVTWILVGDGHGRPEVDALAQELGVASLVHRVGRVPANEVPAWLSAMDAAVLPGCVDTICPIKVQEYMAAGKAPVVPDTEANREVVEHGRTGLLFRRGDPSSLAEQLSSLAPSREYARRLGDAARTEAVTRFSWENTWGRALQEIVATLGDRTDA